MRNASFGRRFALGCSLLVLSGMLTACGNGVSSTPTPTPTPTTVTYTTQGGGVANGQTATATEFGNTAPLSFEASNTVGGYAAALSFSIQTPDGFITLNETNTATRITWLGQGDAKISAFDVASSTDPAIC